MFEDSLIESQVYTLSSTTRWTTIASITLQSAVAATLVILPLSHPERLVSRITPPPVLIPLRPKPPLRVERAQTPSEPSNTNTFVPAVTRIVTLPSLFPDHSRDTDEAPTTSIPDMAMPASIPAALSIGTIGHGTHVSVAAAPPANRPMRISAGVSAGMLMVPIRPVYPAIAKAAGVQGTVVVEAVISRTGTIESLHVVSGPPMLQNAAIEAIHAARYQPYRLNGEPTEVETTITVNFRMGG